MGRMALIIVLGLVFTAGIVTLSVNKSKSRTIENVSGFQRYSIARDLAHTGANMMLHTLDKAADRQDTSIFASLNAGGTYWMSQNIGAGQCSVSLKLTTPTAKDTVDLWSKSKIMDTTYQMILRLQRFPKPFPTVGAAVSLASAPMAFQMNGNPSIDGRDHNLDGSLTASRATDTNGVAVTNAAESLLVAGYNSKITGDPQKVAIQPPPDPASYVQEYVNGADYNFTSGNYSGHYGTADLPVIGSVTGSVTFGGNGSFYGVMVVNGTIDLQGTFNVYGLVICYGDSNTIQTSAGTPAIYGSILITGVGSKFQMKGTADVNYSTAALAIAMYIPKLLAYKVMKWYE
jgi:hypothetical protein